MLKRRIFALSRPSRQNLSSSKSGSIQRRGAGIQEKQAAMMAISIPVLAGSPVPTIPLTLPSGERDINNLSAFERRKDR